MKNLIILLLIGLLGCSNKPIISPRSPSINTNGCKWNDITLYGRVRFVNSSPDIRIQYVNAFPDIRVQFVTSFANDCGRWEQVTSFEDFRVQIVNSNPDIRVEIVSNFPGM